MIFKGNSLEEVYKKASEYFNLSVSELEITIIQAPSKGLFGLFSKEAIIEVKEPSQKKIQNEVIEEKKESEKNEKELKQEILTDDTENKKTDENKKVENNEVQKSETSKKEFNTTEKTFLEYPFEPLVIDEVVKIAKKEINELFKLSCFDVDEIEVKIYDEETIMFIIDGKDAPLLIGREGYRYNALLNMLYHWIFQKYGYKVRLEIAQFLKQQKEMMKKLLQPCIEEVKENGKCKTPAFDGILIFLALEILRLEFPDKYVAIKKNRDGSQYVLVNKFLKRNEKKDE